MRLFRFVQVAVVVAIGSQVSAQDFSAEAVESTNAAVDTYRKSHATAILRDFVELLSIPNVVTDFADMPNTLSACWNPEGLRHSPGSFWGHRPLAHFCIRRRP